MEEKKKKLYFTIFNSTSLYVLSKSSCIFVLSPENYVVGVD